jgi:hypothetical protein
MLFCFNRDKDKIKILTFNTMRGLEPLLILQNLGQHAVAIHRLQVKHLGAEIEIKAIHDGVTSRVTSFQLQKEEILQIFPKTTAFIAEMDLTIELLDGRVATKIIKLNNRQIFDEIQFKPRTII